MDEWKSELMLPGFRFHPTEEELLNFYLKGMLSGNKMSAKQQVIGFLNIYDYDPKDLPGLAKTGEREWYFFVCRDRRKHGGGGRPNRTTEKGFWKATGSDRQILSTSDPSKILGLKKTLVFYQGRAPRGTKTNWIMNEYRLPASSASASASAPKEKEMVLCKIYMKATSLKVLEQRAAILEEDKSLSPPPPPPPMEMEFDEQEGGSSSMMEKKGLKREREEMVVVDKEDEKRRESRGCSSLVLPSSGVMQNLGELQLPKLSGSAADWTQDSFWAQLSPWLDNFTPFFPMC